MCAASHLANRRSSITAWQLAMVLPLLARSLITITSSEPGIKRPTDLALELGRRTRSAGSNLSGNISLASVNNRVVSHAGDNSKEKVIDLISETIELEDRARKKLRHTELLHSNKIEAIKKDYKIMETIVERCPSVENPDFYSSNGKQILESILKRVYHLTQLNVNHGMIKGPQDLYHFGFPEAGLQWEEITWPFEVDIQTLAIWLAKRTSSVEVDHRFRVQFFKLLNMLLKHQLVEGQFVKGLINQKSIMNVIFKHIHWMWSPPIYSGLNVQNSLEKSESSKHLGSLLKLINEDSWRNIEYRFLRQKVYLCTGSRIQIPGDLRKILANFLEAEFHVVHSERENKFRVLNEMKNYFESIGPAQIGIEGNVSQCGIFQEIFDYLLRHEQEMISGIFKKQEDSITFFQKYDILKDAFELLRCAWEFAFMAKSGLVTVEGTNWGSEHYMSWEEAKRYSFSGKFHTSGKINTNFKDRFGFYLGRDIENWTKVFVTSVSAEFSQVEKINMHFGWPEKIKYKVFGTQNLASSLEGLETKKYCLLPIEEKCISKIFIHKTYEWTENLNCLVQAFDVKLRQLSNKIMKLGLEGGEMKRIELKTWLEKSSLSRTIFARLSDYCLKAKTSWIKFSLQFEMLNSGMKDLLKIKSTMSPISEEYRSMLKSLESPEEELLAIHEYNIFEMNQFRHGLNLPVINFPEVKGPDDYRIDLTT